MTPNPLNRLSQEKSPYLLQHKDNPVNWHPWGPEAFAKAKKENKLIFLSIGYSTCYWCHVMEKDSFEKGDVAEVLNRFYVAIKVDREEMPEIDAIYMEAVQGMTGQGGWPLSVFLTPDREPFFGGTFFWRPQFLQILRRAQDEWSNDPQGILEFGRRVTQALGEQSLETGVVQPLDEKIFDATLDALKRGFDAKNGGFGRAPKFPHSMDLDLLLHRYHATRDESLLSMAVKTLDAMARGGIYDQLGGGFHRYSTDDYWFAPHFEKMLYDNALLAGIYLTAFQITRENRFADVVRETLDYVLREMTQPEGGFYTAQDAGEVGKEGEFYAWTHAELSQVLNVEELAHMEILGVTQNGNWEEGKNILHLAEGHSWELRDHPLLKSARQKLFERRQKRQLPHRDDKILVSWNGLMLAAMARAYRVLGDLRYLEAAQKTASFLCQNLDQKDGLRRRYCAGESDFAANLDDHAFLIEGLIELYQSDFDENWIVWARDLQERQNRIFWDEAAGTYYFSAPDDALIVRQKTFYDGVIPSGNAVSLKNLLVLDHLCFVDEFRLMAQKLRVSLASHAGRMVMGISAGLLSLEQMISGGQQVVIVAPDRESLKKSAKEIWPNFTPHCVVAGVVAYSAGRVKASLLNALQDKSLLNGQTTYYRCLGRQCLPPIFKMD